MLGRLGKEKIGKAFVSILLAVAILIAPNSMAASDTLVEKHFDIPQQSVQAALDLLATQANVFLLFPYDEVTAADANPVQGTYSIQRALDILLNNTGLSGDLTEGGVITISQAGTNASASVNNSKGKSMNTNTKKTLLATAIGFFAAGGTGFSVAQEEAATQQLGIDEVVVTAQKREQRLIDVPISIVALQESDIEDLRLSTLDDLAYVVPNLSVASVAEGNTRITIRGIGNLTGSSALVGVYLDEIPLTMTPQVQAELPLLDTQRVEVLRGPQGTLYGQGSSGGTLRFIANSPSFDGINGEISTSFYDTVDGGASNEVSAIVNLPIVDDKLAFRIAASYKDIGGWIDQPDIGKKDANDNQKSHIRVKGLWQATDDLTINAMAIKARNELGGLASSSNTIRPSGDTYYRTVIRNGLPLPSTDNTHSTDIYNLTLNYDLGFATIISSSSHINIDIFNASISSLSSKDPSINTGVLVLDNFGHITGDTQEIRLADNNDNNSFDWIIGVYYADTTNESGSPDRGFYNNGVGNSIGSSIILISSESMAVFANADYHINEQLTFTMGARYFEDDRAGGIVGTEEKSVSFDHLSPRASLSYEINDQATIYASISEGFRSGGFNFFNNETFEPETIRTYEIGTKTLWLDNRLRTEGAIFHSQYLDYQDTDAVLINGILQSGTKNPGEAEIQGIELSTQLSLSDQFSIGFSGSYLGTEFVKTSATVRTVIEGDPLSFVPKYNYSINAKLNFDGPFGASGFALIDYSRQDGQTLTNRTAPASFNLPLETAPSESLNAQIGAKWNALSVRVFGRNLTNERGESFPDVFSIYKGRPRTLGIDFTYKFSN
ncbi:TonB-dependent receptor [Porticoccaceae bacterium]|nr:TonB-dependent receptor [Porticoccaceae bacterium]